jgi:hypothetical protein
MQDDFELGDKLCFLKKEFSWAWWHTPIISVLGGVRWAEAGGLCIGDLLPQLPQYWGYRHVPPCLAIATFLRAYCALAIVIYALHVSP